MAISLNAQTVESGAVLATDTVAGEEHQLIKLGYGAATTSTLVTSTTGLPVEVIGDVSLTGSFTTVIKSGTISTITNPVTVTGGVSISLSTSVIISGPLPAGTNHLGSMSLTGSSSVFISNTVGVAGVAAHDAAVSGNPVLNGWEARSTLPAAVADGDAVRAMADDNGRLVTTPIAPRDLVGMLVHSATVSDTTTWLPAGGAGVYRDIIGFTIMNPSSATQATVTLYSSLTTGTEIMKFELAPNGGLVYTPSAPIPAGAANNAWGIKSSVVGVVSSIQYVNNN